MFGNNGKKSGLTFDGVEIFDNQRPTSPEAIKMVTYASMYLRMKGVDLNPVFVDSFDQRECIARIVLSK